MDSPGLIFACVENWDFVLILFYEFSPLWSFGKWFGFGLETRLGSYFAWWIVKIRNFVVKVLLCWWWNLLSDILCLRKWLEYVWEWY